MELNLGQVQTITLLDFGLAGSGVDHSAVVSGAQVLGGVRRRRVWSSKLQCTARVTGRDRRMMMFLESCVLLYCHIFKLNSHCWPPKGGSVNDPIGF